MVIKIFIRKSAEFNLELDSKAKNGITAFHCACVIGHFEVAEMFIQKSAEFNIELNTKDQYGWTPQLFIMPVRIAILR